MDEALRLVFSHVSVADRMAVLLTCKRFLEIGLRAWPPWADGALGLMHAVECGHYEYYRHWSTVAAGRVQWTEDWIDCGSFRSACRYGHENLVRLLLADPATNVHANEDEGWRRACEMGHEHIVRLLLQDGRCTPSARDYFGFRMAARLGRTAVVALLLRTPGAAPPSLADDDGVILMREVAYQKHADVLRLLVDFAPLPARETFLLAAAKADAVEVARTVLLSAHMQDWLWEPSCTRLAVPNIERLRASGVPTMRLLLEGAVRPPSAYDEHVVCALIATVAQEKSASVLDAAVDAFVALSDANKFAVVLHALHRGSAGFLLRLFARCPDLCHRLQSRISDFVMLTRTLPAQARNVSTDVIHRVFGQPFRVVHSPPARGGRPSPLAVGDVVLVLPGRSGAVVEAWHASHKCPALLRLECAVEMEGTFTPSHSHLDSEGR